MDFVNRISLVIFDMDGLMLDTESLAVQTWIKLVKLMVLIFQSQLSLNQLVVIY